MESPQLRNLRIFLKDDSFVDEWYSLKIKGNGINKQVYNYAMPMALQAFCGFRGNSGRHKFH